MNPEEYDKMYELEDHYWWFVGRRELALNLLAINVQEFGFDLLDVGCGTGAVLQQAAKFARPVGADFTELALTKCQRRGLRNLALSDATALPFADAAFSGVIGLDIFEHVLEHEAAIEEAFRVLRPGGFLVLSVPAFRTLWGPHDVALHHHRRYTLPEMERILQRAGFEVTLISYAVFFLFPLVVISRVIEKFHRGPAKANLPMVPDWLNRALISLQDFEGRLLWKRTVRRYPWGSSVVAVARKPI